MSLPTKKQLHKHKRGTRKALDTLDAMENDSEIPGPEEEIIKSRKKTKKNLSEKNKKALEITLDDESNSIDLGEDDSTENLAGKDKKESNQDAKDVSEKAVSNDEIEMPVEKHEQVEKAEMGTVILSDEEVAPEVLSIKNTEQLPEPPEKIEPLKTEIKEEKGIEPGKTRPKSSETKDVNKEKKIDDVLYDEETIEDTQRDKYLTFRLEPENYAISIKYVVEIIVLQRITEVPDTPEFVIGVINLRGKVIPVIDVRRRFGLETREYDERTCIIVVDIDGIAVGMIVDTVNEVVDIPADQVDPAPRTHSGVESSYIQGMGKVGKDVKILLDVKRVTHNENKIDEDDEI